MINYITSSLEKIGKYGETANKIKDYSSQAEIFSVFGKDIGEKYIGEIAQGLQGLNVDDAIKQLSKLEINPELTAEIVRAANDMNLLKGSTQEIEDGLKGLGAQSTSIERLKNAFAGLRAEVLKLLKTPMTWFVAAIAAMSFAAYKSYKAFDDHMDKTSMSTGEYENTQSELESLNSELETTENKINELSKKDNLTITEKEELENLKNQNAELNRQIDLKKALANSQKKQAEKDALDTLSLNRSKDTTQATSYSNMGAIGSSTAGSYKKTDIITAAKNELSRLSELKAERKKALEKYKKADDDEKKVISDQIESLDKEITEKENSLNDKIADLNELRKALADAPSKEGRKHYDILTEIIDSYNDIDLTPLEKQAKIVDNFFSEEKNSGLKNYFAEAAKNGNDLIDALNNMGLSLSDLGLSGKEGVEALNSYFEQLSQTTENVHTNVSEIIADSESDFSKAQVASESANQGDAYNSMYEMAKKAKELLKSGDVGTDDFKSIAKMFSPSGADDYKNFEENLGKIQRYFTEDNSGVKNFLKDLEKNDFAKYDEETKQWTYSINDLEEAARKMGMGFEPFMAMFGELEDKGFNNDFFSTADEGGQKLSELTKGLMQSQKELQNLRDTDPENSTAIEAKKAEIQDYKDRIDACKKSLAELLNENGGVEGSIAETEQSQKLVKGQVKDFNSTAKQKEYRGDNRNVLEPTAQTIIDAGKEAGFDYQLKEVQTKSGEIRYKLVLEGKDEAEKDIKDVTDKEYKAEVTTQVDTKEIDNLEDDIPDEDALSRTVELIGEDNATPIIEQWDEMDAPDKEATLTGKDKATAVVRLWNYISADDKEGVLSGQDKASWVINTWNQLSPEDKQAILEADGTEATDVLSKVLGMTGEVDSTTAKPTIDATDHASAKINSVSNKMDALDGKKATTTIETVKVTTTKNNTSSGGSGKKKSTQAHGTLPAYANGSNVTSDGRLRRNEEAVINEVEKEWVIRNGQILEFNDGYPTKAKLKRGDIVLNHRQVNQLEEKGYVKGSHAKIVGGESAFSNGTVVGNAYAGVGSGGGILINEDKKKSSSSKSNSSRKSSSSKSNSNKKSTKNTENKTSKKWDKWVEKLGDLFDWIEVRLDVLSRKTEKWTNAAENAVNYSAKKANYNKAVSSTIDEMNANQSAETKYLKKAKNIGKKAAGKSKSDNITQKWVNGIMAKLESGTLDITKYSGKKLDVVEKMKEWYDKSQDASERFTELSESLADLYSELENLANNEAAEKIEEIDHQLSLLSTKYDMANSLEARQANLQAQNQRAKETMDAYNKAYSSTSSSLKQAIDSLGSLGISANGTTGIDANDKMSVAQLKAVAKYNAALEASKEALRNAQQAQTDYNKTLYDNAHQMFQNIIDEFEYKREIIAQKSTRINNAMELNETKGYRNSKVYYEGIMASSQEEYNTLQQAFAQAEARLEQNLREKGADYKGTENYQAEVKAINDIINQMDEMNIQIAETQNSINELDWDNFDKLQESISRVTDEASFLIDELSRKELTDVDEAGLTEEGKAALSLYVGNYGTAKEQAELYWKEIRRLKEELSKDPENETLKNRIDDLTESALNSTSAFQEAKYAAIELVKDGFEAQKEHLQEIINKYKELMDKQQDAYEYQKSLNLAMKEINNVQKQIEVFSGDDSEENRAKLQQLNTELMEKQESLEDMQREKLTADINNMFDDLMDSYGDYIDDLISDLDEHFNELITSVNANLSNTNSTITGMAGELGIQLSDEIAKIQTGNDILANISAVVGTNGESGIHSIIGAQEALINSTNTNAQNIINAIDKAAENLEMARTNAANSGSSSSGGNLSSGESSSSANSSISTQGTQEQALKAKYEKDKKDFETAVKFIANHYFTPKQGTKAKDIKDPVKKKIFQRTGNKTLQEKDLDKLAQKLGVGENQALYHRLDELGVFNAIGKNGVISYISYAKGSKKIPRDMIGRVGEAGSEIIYRSSDGSILTPLGKNDMVFTHEMSENLWQMAKERDIKTVPGVEESQYNKTVSYGSVVNNSHSGDIVFTGDIVIEGVQNPEEFAQRLKQSIKSDSRVRGLLKEVTVNELNKNHNSLNMMKW